MNIQDLQEDMNYAVLGDRVIPVKYGVKVIDCETGEEASVIYESLTGRGTQSFSYKVWITRKFTADADLNTQISAEAQKDVRKLNSTGCSSLHGTSEEL